MSVQARVFPRASAPGAERDSPAPKYSGNAQGSRETAGVSDERRLSFTRKASATGVPTASHCLCRPSTSLGRARKLKGKKIGCGLSCRSISLPHLLLNVLALKSSGPPAVATWTEIRSRLLGLCRVAATDRSRGFQPTEVHRKNPNKSRSDD